MAKTIFFNIPAQGHINPSLPVIRELVARGEQVMCVNAEDTRSAHAATGAAFTAYPHIPAMAPLMNNASGGSLAANALALVQIAEQLMPWVLDLLTREKPDYVIFDSLASWAKQGAQKLGIPAAGSVSTFVLVPGALPPMPMSSLLSMVGSLIPRLPTYWQVAGRMQRQFGVKGVGLTGALMNTGRMNVVYTSALFQPGSEKLDGRYQFVGPALAARPAANDFPFESLTGSPVVYISLGTINNDNLAFYRQCFAAFGDYQAQFILSAGKRTDITALGTIPDNFIVRNFVPQLEVLQRTDAFISHGGMNSVHESLYYNVPLVVIPQHFEQALVAQQVVKHGAGVALADKPPFGQVTAAELRSALDQVMQARSRYQTAAAQVGESLRTAGGYERAAAAYMAFGRGQYTAIQAKG